MSYTFRNTSTPSDFELGTTRSLQVEIDDSPPDSPNCTSGGTNNNRLEAPDYTRIYWTDTIFPGSIRPGWDGTPYVAAAHLRNDGNRDYFDFNADFGLDMFEPTALDLRLNVVAGTVSFSSSSIELIDDEELRIRYAGASVNNVGNGSARYSTKPGVRDVAGNVITSTASARSCSRNEW